MNYTLVKMSEEHISQLAEIEKICFHSPWTEEGLREELTNPMAHFYVAVADKVIGYMGVIEICGEANVTNVAVLPEYRGNGIGKALVKNAIDGAKSRECEFITLEVRESNLPAINLYKSFGFQQVGVRKNFYSDPTENALLMTINF